MASATDFAYRQAMEQKSMTHVKCCIVGNVNVGKTSLLRTYIKKDFHSQEKLETWEHVTLGTGTGTCNLLLVDADPYPEYNRLVPLSYPSTDVFLLCFSVDSPDSCDRIERHWLHEIRHVRPDTPFLVVGMKIDLRDGPARDTDLATPNDDGTKFISSELGDTYARRLGAVKYAECSALTGRGVSDVFLEAAKLARQHSIKKKTRRSCIVM